MKQVRESHFLKGFMLFGIKYIRGQKIILMYTLFCSRKEEGLNSLIFRTLKGLKHVSWIRRICNITSYNCSDVIWITHMYKISETQSTLIPKKCLYQLTSFAYFGRISDPWHKNEPIPNHKALEKVNWVSSSSGSDLHGWGLSHSYGVILDDGR